MSGWSSAGPTYFSSHQVCVFGLEKLRKNLGVGPPERGSSVPQGSLIGLPLPGGDCSQISVSFMASRKDDQKVLTTSVLRSTMTPTSGRCALSALACWISYSSMPPVLEVCEW